MAAEKKKLSNFDGSNVAAVAVFNTGQGDRGFR